VTADRHTAEQAPETGSEAPESASTPEVGVSGGFDPLSGPQAGAESLDGDQQPRGPVDWARHYADQRGTQPAASGETETLTATVARVRRLGAELFVDGATRTHRAIGRQILNALQPPEDGETTPADEARLDRAHWDAKYAGEGQ
jgi:hypothetical protein